LAKKYDKLVAVRLSRELVEKVDSYAKSAGTTRSEVLRTLILSALRQRQGSRCGV